MTLLDGHFPWGAVISTPLRYGATQRQLIVYPPGITKTDRRWLRLWRGFAIWGGPLWFALQVCLFHVMAPWHAIAAAVGVCSAAGATAFVMAAATRGRVRTLTACVFAAGADPDSAKDQRRLRLFATTLLAAHVHHSRGELSAVEYEMLWWHVYDAMAPESGPPRNPRTASQQD
ncbi:DUF6611 family protein [Mycolicibacterium baixiangningiae]|uniref:DUF6611 family protein n=1 Tax=Mycolicibacterium baixiangningiae TaxID=2761578 RepID=UPI001866A985|nr:DUF6611 family protein [Mycolicibacterium baixiangningiae]